MPQVATSNFTDDQISAIISSKNRDVSVNLFELLPQFIRDQDESQIIKGFIEAVQAEYDRSKESITDIITIIDPQTINRAYKLSGNPVFFHPDQFIYGGTPLAPNQLVLNGAVSGVSGSGYYVNFGIFVWSDSATPEAVGQYKKVIVYDGPSRTATLDEDWTVLPSPSAVYALCWYDRIWLPVPLVSDPRKPGGTLFPDQNASGDPTGSVVSTTIVLLPGLSYLSTIDGYYTGWTLDFLDGKNIGKSVKISGFDATLKTLTLEQSVSPPDANDWFRISPPESESIGISDDFYAGRWLHISAAAPGTISYGNRTKAQARQIIRSRFDPLTTPASHVAYVYDSRTEEGSIFSIPPAPTMLYGISNYYIPFQYLSSYLGIELDEDDLELYQREQMSQAYNFHRLRGSRRAIELVCKSFGIDAEVDEAASNYVPAPSNENVGPGAVIEGNHKQYFQRDIVPIIKQGRGIDDVPQAYLTPEGADLARVQDSDIRLYLSRSAGSSISFDGTLLGKILRRLNPIIPIHVQIIFVGLLTRIQEPVDIDAQLTCEIRPLIEELVTTTEGFIGTPIGTVPYNDSYSLIPNLDVAISAPARYSKVIARYSRFGAIPGTARWSRGSIVFLAQ